MYSMNEILKKIKLSRLPKSEQCFLNFINNSNIKIDNDKIFIISDSNKYNRIQIHHKYYTVELSVSIEFFWMFDDYFSDILKTSEERYLFFCEMINKYTKHKVKRYNLHFIDEFI